MKTLYIFIDESGNFDFSPNGTKYFVLTSLSTNQPFTISSPLLRLRYDLLPNYSCGPKMEESGYFHAAEDTQSVRNSVFDILKTSKDTRIDSIIAQKNKANPIFYHQHLDIYKIMGQALLKYCLNRANWDGFEHVVIVFSSLFDKKKRGALKQTFKSLIKQMSNSSYSLYFHDSKFDLCNQAVDYFGWAIYRKWESQDERSYQLVKKQIKSEFTIFQRGDKEFYQYNKKTPLTTLSREPRGSYY